jgi:hypothetical protein
MVAKPRKRSPKQAVTQSSAPAEAAKHGIQETTVRSPAPEDPLTVFCRQLADGATDHQQGAVIVIHVLPGVAIADVQHIGCADLDAMRE